MKKNNSPILTIIVGFIAGLAISGVLGDMIGLIGNAADKVSCAWTVSRAEKYIAGGNFIAAKKEYDKILNNTKSVNKRVLAKVQNNTAMIIFNEGDKQKDAVKIKEALFLFSQSLENYKILNDSESSKEVERNIKEANSVLASLDENKELKLTEFKEDDK